MVKLMTMNDYLKKAPHNWTEVCYVAERYSLPMNIVVQENHFRLNLDLKPTRLLGFYCKRCSWKIVDVPINVGSFDDFKLHRTMKAIDDRLLRHIVIQQYTLETCGLKKILSVGTWTTSTSCWLEKAASSRKSDIFITVIFDHAFIWWNDQNCYPTKMALLRRLCSL